MLDNVRKLSGSIFFKILLGVLILSFVLWGISDFIRGSSRDYVASVGSNHYISTDKFLSEKKKIIMRLRQAYPQITDNELKLLNLNRSIIKDLVVKKLLELEAESLGIVISDEVIIQQLRKDKNFQDKDGKFDPILFKNILAQNQLTEQEFVSEQKSLLATNMVLQTFSIPPTVPVELEKMVAKYNNQKRVATLVKANYSKLYTPSKAEIESYYKDHINEFSTPEERDVEYIFVQPAQLAKQVSISDAEVKEELDRISKDQITPQLREEIKTQLKFQKIDRRLVEVSQEIEDEIASGESLKAISEKFKIGYGSINKYNPKEEKKAPKFLDFNKHVFEAEQNQPSSLYNIDSAKPGYYTVNVKKIYPAKPLGITPEVNVEISRILTKNFRNNQNRQIIVKAYDQLESGKNLRSLTDVTVANHTFVRPTGETSESAGVPSDAIITLFNLDKVGEKTKIFSANKNSYGFLILDKIINPSKKPTAEDLSAIEKLLTQNLASIQRNEFLQFLQNKYPVEVRSELLEKL